MASQGKDTAEFKLNLDTGGLNGAAASAADHLDRLRARIEGDEAALRNMQKSMKQLQGGTSVNVQTFRELEARIAAQKDKIANARSEYLNLGGTFDKLRPKPKQTQSALDALADSAQAAGGPLGAMAGRVSGLMGAASKAGPLLLLAAGIVAVTTAAIAGAAALTRYGLAQADARRDEMLRLEGLTKMRFLWHQMAYGQRIAADSASFLQEQIDRVSDKVALGRDQIESWTSRLYKMGLRGGNLQQALEGVSIAASTVGDSQAEMYLGLMMGAAQTGKSVRAVADDIRARLGPLAERQLLSWSVQSKKLRENLQRLFQGVGVENLLRPVAEITKLFSQTSVTGRALRQLLERLFRPLEAALPIVAHMSKRFIQGMIIGYLAAELQVHKFVGVLLDTLGPTLDWLAGKLGDVDSDMLIAAFEGLGTAVSMVSIAALTGIAVGLTAISVGAYAAYTQLEPLVTMIRNIAKRIQSDEPVWEKAGKSIVDGLATGVLGQGPKLLAQITQLGGKAIAAFKSALKIQSPSRIMFQLGGHVTEGAAIGVRAGVPRFEQAVRAMAEVPARVQLDVPQLPRLPQPAGNPFRPSQQRAGASVHVGELHVHAESSEPKDLARRVRDALLSELEGVAIEMGAAPVVVA